MKQPAFQFYPGDWLKDPKLSMCSPVTRGIWLDAICAMHELGRSGVLTGTPTQLVRPLRCTETELHFAIAELQATGTAEIREHNGVVTLVNRRMKREFKARADTASRQNKHRESQKNNAPVTPPSQPSSSSSSTSPSKNKTREEGETPPPMNPIRLERRKEFTFLLPLKDGTNYELPGPEVQALAELYPSVAVGQELRNLTGWLVSDRRNLKTRRGIKRSVHHWMRKAIQFQEEATQANGNKPDFQATLGKHDGNTRKLTDREQQETDRLREERKQRAEGKGKG